MPVNVSVDDSNLRRRLSRIQKKIDAGAKLSVQEVSRWTRDKIIQFMPKDTGDSARSIIYRVEKMTPDIKEVVVTQGTFKPHPTRQWKGKWFNVPLWMFESPKALGHPWRNGSITTMRSVPSLAFVKFRQSVREELGKALN